MSATKPARTPSARTLLSRRGALAVGGTAAVTAVVAACSDDPEYSEAKARPDDAGETNLAFATLAAGLEVAAVQAYDAAAKAAADGALGPVPVVVGAFVDEARGHHQTHLDAWNRLLTDAARPEVVEPNATLKAAVDQALGEAKDVAGAANAALGLERALAHTYAKAIPTLYNLDITPSTPGLGGIVVERDKPDPVRTAAQCQVVDQQHQALLLYVMGQYPVPDDFQGTDQAIAG